MRQSNSLFSVTFQDGSTFTLPKEWEDVFADYYGQNAASYTALADRLRFVVGKYVAHRAWPSKFDGFGIEAEDDGRYDDPDFYFEHWDEWGDRGRDWGDRTIGTPTWADLAEAVIYQSMRSGIMQKALDTYAKETGTKAPRVMTPEQLLEEMKRQEEEDKDSGN